MQDNSENKHFERNKRRLRLTTDKDIIASSAVMIVFCIGMTRGGFQSFQISITSLILFSIVLYLLIKQKVSAFSYGLNLLPFVIVGFLLIPLQMLLNDGYYNAADAVQRGFVYLIMVFAVCMIVNESNGAYLWKIVNIFSFIGAALIIIEEAFYLVGIRLNEIAGMNETIFRGFRFQFFRPCGMFSEPSHFAQMGLLSAFYYLFINKNFVKFAIIGSALIISTSALGIVGLVLFLLLYAVHYIFGSSIGQLKKVIFILILAVGGALFVNWVFLTDNPVVLRVLSGGTSSVRINRSFELFGMLDPLKKMIGVGSQNQAHYLNYHHIILPSDAAETLVSREFAQTFGYILCTLGIVGAVVFAYPFLKMFIKGNYILKYFILLFGYLCLTACIDGTSTFLVYIILVYSLYAGKVCEQAAVPVRQAVRAEKKQGLRFVWKMPIWLEEDDGKTTGIREENVSFAVFDTLIRRSVGRPADLFRIMEQNDPSVPEHFAEKRMEAERAAFAKLGARMGLADIYEELIPLYGNHTNDLMALEIQYEIAGCRPVADNIDLVNLCMEHDKNVFLLADTYLPSSVIRRMLDVCGVYHYDRLYVSCEEGACKADGSLFWKVLADQEIRPSELRHIGSDRQGDVAEPWRVGVHVKRGKKKDLPAVDTELPENIALYERTLQACIQNCADDLDSDDARLGCETFGPLLVGFAAWLREQLRRDGIQDVYFLAGDGAVLKQAFDALEDDNFRTHSLYFPEQTAEQDHEALLAYIRACGMQGKVALVDTGRQTIIQKTLEQLIAEAGLDIQIKGYYVGLNPDADSMQAAGYLYKPGQGKETQEKLSPITILFDTIFHAQHGAVRRIAMRDGQPVPELDDYEYASDEGRICDEIAILRAYQAGAIELVREMNEAFPGGVPQIPGEAALLPLLRMGTKPTLQEAELWGDFRVFMDGKAVPMARPKGMGYYLLHPGRLKRDYAASPWKIGFLRRMIRLPLSYDKIVARHARKR